MPQEGYVTDNAVTITCTCCEVRRRKNGEKTIEKREGAEGSIKKNDADPIPEQEAYEEEDEEIQQREEKDH